MSEWERRELTDVVDAVRAAVTQGVVDAEHSGPWLLIGREAKEVSRRIDLRQSEVRELKVQLCQQCKEYSLFQCEGTIGHARGCRLLQLAA